MIIFLYVFSQNYFWGNENDNLLETEGVRLLQQNKTLFASCRQVQWCRHSTTP
jgi:hypothetical protein